jgi:phosphoesterase RecJ-like protein
MWEKTAEFIKSKSTFLLTTHINPEGDAIGSEIALKEFLQSIGKKVYVVNSSPTPKNCLFLDPKREIKVYPSDYDPRIMQETDALIILDVNAWIHLGSFAEEIKKSGKPGVCIDHHEGYENDFVDVYLGDTSAASAGVLVYELIKFMGGEITPRISDAIYASLITDTGNFRFTNTNARAFRIAAELHDLGVDPFSIYRKVFANRSWGAAHLIGPVMNTLRSAADGKIAWIQMTADMLEEAGAEYEDSDGLLDLVRAIKGVELCMFFKETGRGDVKISLRSNGRIDAYKLARKFGGGGHRMASGMVLGCGMEEAVEAVLAEALELGGFRK